MHLLNKKRIFTIFVVPHSEDAVFSFRLPLFVFQLVCLMLLAVIIFAVVTFINLQKTSEKVDCLEKYEQENRLLKENIDKLARETEDLKLQLAQMSVLSSEIMVLADVASYEETANGPTFPGLEREENTRIFAGRGGNPVLHRAQTNISMLQESIPQQTEQLFQLKDDLEEYRREMACTPSIWPTSGRVSSRFGPRRSPITGRREMHYGLDIAAPKGTPIYAAADGKVIEATYRRGTGNVITIAHGYGYKTLYAHLSRFGIEKGDAVQKGQVIGYVGSTGLSTGPHLHYEVHVNGIAVNPQEYLP